MTLNLESEIDTAFPFDVKEQAELLLTETMDYLECPYEAEVNLLLTDNEGIHQINKNTREIDKETDVLSFPMTEYCAPADFGFLEEEGIDCFNPESGELMLGDIVISADKVIEQAENFGHSQLREYSFLVVHSLLHLTGFDHMTEEDAKEMERRQKEILDRLEIYR